MQNTIQKIKPAFDWGGFSFKSFASLEKNLHIFLQRWFLNSFEIVLQPLMYFLAFGFGLEKWVSDIEGLSYHAYVFLGIIAATAMSTALYESSQSIYERYLVGRTYLVLKTCPIDFREVLFGEWLWSIFRSVLACSILLLIGSSIDVVSPLDFLPILLSCIWLSIIFSSFGLYIAARVKSFSKSFQYSALFSVPMLLFSGVFFPISELPRLVEKVISVLPLSLAINWVRTDEFTEQLVPSLLYVFIYLFISLAVFNWSAAKIAEMLEAKSEEKVK